MHWPTKLCIWSLTNSITSITNNRRGVESSRKLQNYWQHSLQICMW
jgi:hypothetical protein